MLGDSSVDTKEVPDSGDVIEHETSKVHKMADPSTADDSGKE